MTLVENSSFSLYFGSRIDRLTKKLEETPDHAVAIKRLLNAETIIFTKQVHGTDGLHITKHTLAQRPYHILDQCADFLVSNEVGVALGIIAADCLPLVLYDSTTHCIAVVHAGWKGTVQSVAVRALETMVRLFGASKKTIQVYFGPYARSCCYEVGDDVLAYIPDYYHSYCVRKYEEKYFFDTGLFNRLQLLEAGVNEKCIIEEHTACTMCLPHFYSFRRDQGMGRQATVAMLR